MRQNNVSKGKLIWGYVSYVKTNILRRKIIKMSKVTKGVPYGKERYA